MGKGPKGYTRSDERIEEEVAQRLAEGYLDSSEIEVTVKNGEVSLQGTVGSKDDRRLAEDLIEHCFGVKDVDNRLKVRRGKSGEDESMSAGKESRVGKEGKTPATQSQSSSRTATA